MTHKNDLAGLTVRGLRARRRRLASGLSDVEALLRGTVVSQLRRCGKETCRCASGQLPAPYAYLNVARPGGRRPRLVYVPAELAETVAGQVAIADRAEAGLAAVTAVNAELLARRAPG